MLVPSGSEGCGISSRDFCSTSESSAVTTDSDMAVSLCVREGSGGRSDSGGRSVVEGGERVPEDQVAEFAAAGGFGEAGVLAGEVAPRLVAGEEHPVVADAAALDLLDQPAGSEADGPGEIGVDA